MSGYGHVGRPTNEEVASRKRKKIIKFMVPVIAVVAIVVAISSGGFNGLMGNSVFDNRNCICEEGWEKGDNQICYKESTETSSMAALLLGDANGDGKVTDADYALMNGKIESGVELDSSEKAIFDFNADKEINDEDLTSFIELLSGGSASSSTVSGRANTVGNSYVCPFDETKETIDENGQNVITNVTYQLVQDQCSITTKIRTEKEAVCEKETSNKVEVEKEPATPIDDSGATVATNCPDDDMKVVYDEELKQNVCRYNADTGETIETVIDDETYTDADDNEEFETEQNSNSYNLTDEEDSDSDEYGYVTRQSNLFEYGKAIKELDKYSIRINTIDSKTGKGAVGKYSYDVYKDADCNTKILEGQVIDNSKIGTWNIKVTPGKANAYTTDNLYYNILENDWNDSTSDIVKNAWLSGSEVIVYVKANNSSSRYNFNDACLKVKLGSNNVEDRDIVNKVDPIKDNESTITIDFNEKITGYKSQTVSNDNKKVKFNSSGNTYIYLPVDTAFVNGFKSKKNGKNYKFYGWAISKKQNNKTYYYCKDAKGNKAWAEKCGNGRVVFGTNLSKNKNLMYGTNEGIKTLKEGQNVASLNSLINGDKKADYTLTALWKKDQIRFVFYNSEAKKNSKSKEKDKRFKRYVRVSLYADKTSCLSEKANKIKTIKQDGTKYKTNKGVLDIDNPNYSLTAPNKAKAYYVKLKSSSIYEDYKNQCFKVGALKKTIKIDLKPKKIKVSFDGNGSTSGKMTSKTKYNDIIMNVPKVGFQKKGYVFDGWKIRKYRNDLKTKKEEKVYLCYDSSKKDKEKVWVDANNKDSCQKYGYVIYDKDGNGFSFNRVSNNEKGIELIATWKKGTYTIEYSAGGGTGVMSNQTGNYGKNVTLSSNKFSKSGYNFKGWKLYNKTTKKYYCYNSKNTKEWTTNVNNCNNNGYVMYKNGSSIGSSLAAGTTLKLTAAWEKIPTVTESSSGSSSSDWSSGGSSSGSSSGGSSTDKITVKMKDKKANTSKTSKKSTNKVIEKKGCPNGTKYVCDSGYKKIADFGDHILCRSTKEVDYYKCKSGDKLKRYSGTTRYYCEHITKKRVDNAGKCTGPHNGKMDAGRIFVPSVYYTCSLNGKGYGVSASNPRAKDLAYQECASSCVKRKMVKVKNTYAPTPIYKEKTSSKTECK